MGEGEFQPAQSFDVFEVRRLTFDLSGPPKAGPLEGRVRPLVT